MDTITNALTLKEEAPRSHVALAYISIGLLVGTFFLSK